MEKIKLFELKKNQTDFDSIQVKESKDAYNVIKQFYGDDINVYESFFILTLNRQNITTGYAKISAGGICHTTVDIRILAKIAIDSLATGVILAHNHPSGNKNFSQNDINLTKRIKNAFSLLDIEVLDHLVLTDDSYNSMADLCLM